MSYATIPSRTTADPNAASDINQLQDNIEALFQGDKNFDEIVFSDTTSTAGLHTESGVLKWQGSTVNTGSSNAGYSPPSIIGIPAGAFDYPTANYAPLQTTVGTNGNLNIHLFDDTTEESLLFDFEVPFDLNTGGTVAFQTQSISVVATAGKNIAWKVYHSAKNDGEQWDAAYASVLVDDQAVSQTQGDIDRIRYSTAVSALGWSANDNVRAKFAMPPATTNNLANDRGLIHFSIKIPRSS